MRPTPPRTWLALSPLLLASACLAQETALARADLVENALKGKRITYRWETTQAWEASTPAKRPADPTMPEARPSPAGKGQASGEYVIDRGPEWTSFTGEWPSQAPDRGLLLKIELGEFFSSQTSVIRQVPPPGPNPASEVVTVFSHSQSPVATPPPRSANPFLGTSVVFAFGFSPRGRNGMEWVQQDETLTGSNCDAAGKVRAGTRQTCLETTIHQTEKGPDRFEDRYGDAKAAVEITQVRAWKKVGDVEIPSDFTYQRRLSFTSIAYHVVLIGVGPSENPTPKIAVGTAVRDWRHVGKDFTHRGFPPPGAIPATYPWPGKLPDQSLVPVPRAPAPPARFHPLALLAAASLAVMIGSAFGLRALAKRRAA